MQHIYVCIYERPVYEKYKDTFKDIKNVDIVLGDITTYKVDCIATGGNSFGIMDSGLDSLINHQLGGVQHNVQEHIERYYYGECPIGSSFIVNLHGMSKFKYLCYTPTMRVLENVSQSLNAYYAMRSTLVTCLNCDVKQVIVPLFCGGVGKMSVKEILRQYHMAIESVFGESHYKWDDLCKFHSKLKKVECKIDIEKQD